MVDALRAAHRRVKRGGIVIDARPDARRLPRIIARGRVRGHIRQSGDADERDRSADLAVERVVARGLLRRTGERGHVWHTFRFADLAELDDYVSDSARYARYERGTRAALVPFRREPLVVRRAIRFEVLERP
ncbi:MAG TPA: hypothetical protein VGA16_12100 [Candidatus Limnocylindria bacterium]